MVEVFLTKGVHEATTSADWLVVTFTILAVIAMVVSVVLLTDLSG
jgi:hypothetical protein